MATGPFSVPISILEDLGKFSANACREMTVRFALNYPTQAKEDCVGHTAVGLYLALSRLKSGTRPLVAFADLSGSGSDFPGSKSRGAPRRKTVNRARPFAM